MWSSHLVVHTISDTAFEDLEVGFLGQRVVEAMQRDRRVEVLAWAYLVGVGD